MHHDTKGPHVGGLGVGVIQDDLGGTVGQGAVRVVALLVGHLHQSQTEVDYLSNRPCFICWVSAVRLPAH